MSKVFTKTIGLDISDFRIRGCQLQWHRRHAPTVQALSEVDVPSGSITNGEINDPAGVAKLITQCLAEPEYGKVTTPYANIAISEKHVFLKVIEVPDLPPEELPGAIKWSIEQYIPVDPDTCYYDWVTLNGRPDGKQSILLSVTPKAVVDSLVSVISRAGLTPICSENESIAVSRCLLNQDDPITHPLMIVDLGRSRTTTIIISGQSVQFSSSLEISGQYMTKLVASALKLSPTDAEKAKIIYGLDGRKNRGAVKRVLEPGIKALSGKLLEQLRYFETYLAPKQTIPTVVLTGSGSQMVGLPSYLQQAIRRTIIIGDQWANLQLPREHDTKFQQQSYRGYTTAIGLALRRFNN